MKINSKNNKVDIIPKCNFNGNFLNEDLKIIDFKLLRIKKLCNIYFVPVYVLTDLVPTVDCYFYETMIRIGYSDNFRFLSEQERCFSKLEAYRQHKVIYKKLIKGFYDLDIIKCIEKENRGNF